MEFDGIGWRTIAAVKEADRIFDKVNIGDEVAITQYEEDFWWLGTVIDIRHEKGSRSDRFQERKIIDVKCFESVVRTRYFHPDCVEQILFKD